MNDLSFCMRTKKPLAAICQDGIDDFILLFLTWILIESNCVLMPGF